MVLYVSFTNVLTVPVFTVSRSYSPSSFLAPSVLKGGLIIKQPRKMNASTIRMETPATMELASVNWTFILEVFPFLPPLTAYSLTFLGVIAFLAAAGLLAGEYFFPQMSSVKTRRHFVLGDLGFSGTLAPLGVLKSIILTT